MNDNMEEKRMAGDYEIIQAVQIGDREVVLGENPQDETGMKYMCAFCRQNALFATMSLTLERRKETALLRGSNLSYNEGVIGLTGHCLSFHARTGKL